MGHNVYATMRGPSEFSATGTLKDYDRTPRLHEIGVPTLFLCGRYDEATPEATKWYQSLVPGAEMIFFEHSAHMPHLEETERCLGVVRDFLSRLEKNGPADGLPSPGYASSACGVSRGPPTPVAMGDHARDDRAVPRTMHDVTRSGHSI